MFKPILEYSSCVWPPYKLTFIDTIEGTQPDNLKQLQGLCDLLCGKHLQALNLDC